MSIFQCKGDACDHPCLYTRCDGWGDRCVHCGGARSVHGPSGICIHVRQGDHGWACKVGHTFTPVKIRVA